MRTTLTIRLRDLLHDDEGQDLLEYALLGSFIAIGAYVAVQSTGTSIDRFYDVIDATISRVQR